MTQLDANDDRWLDLALGQGPRPELDRLRDEVASDPIAAIEYAETRDLLERMRGLAVEPGPAFAERLERLCRAADERQLRRRPAPPVPIWPFVTAAAALFAVLALLDPLGLRRPPAELAIHVPAPMLGAPLVNEPSPEVMTSVLARAAEAARRLAPDSQLTTAWLRFESATREQRLSDWLSARNAMAMLRLDHELRATADERRSVLRGPSLQASVERRVRDLAATLADDVENGLADAPSLSLALRAMVAAPTGRTAAIATATSRLSAQLPGLEGGTLAMALCALGEAAAASGSADFGSLARHGDRLVRSVLEVSDEVWSRRRPRLLQAGEPAANLAAAGRFLRFATAFGVDADEARAVRLLLRGHLCERLEGLVDTPDLPTALVYGFGDLLEEQERTALERQLRRWRPDALVPDFLALQQLAATRSPDHLGYARWQLELRAVVAIASPQSASDRAALCLCLASSTSTSGRGVVGAGS